MKKKSLWVRFIEYFTDIGDDEPGEFHFTGTFLFPWLFCFALMYAFLYAYTEEYFSGWVGLAIFFTITFFCIFSSLTELPALSRVLRFGMLMMSVGIITYALIFFSGNFGYGFFIWFLSGDSLIETKPVYLAALTLSFSFFFSAVIFYFGTQVYRKHWLVLIGILPFIIFVKLSVTIPIWIVITVVGLQLFIYLAKLREGYDKKEILAGQGSVFKVYGDFAIALVLAVALIPKPAETPFWEEFEELLGQFTLSYQGEEGGAEGLSLRSGNADNAAILPNRLLYTMATGSFHTEYLKLQSFPYYNGDGDYWYILDENLENSHSFYTVPEVSYSLLEELAGEALKRDSTILERYGVDFPGLKTTEGVYTATITAQNHTSPIIPAPSRTTQINVIRVSANSFSPTKLFGGGIVSSLTPREDEKYRVSYYTDIADESGLNSSFRGLETEAYGAFLNDLATAQEEGGFARDIAHYVSSDYQEAIDWRHFNSYQSESLRELSDEITAGLTDDYDKAKAIERYFYENGFSYNLGYNAPVDTPEYFIFTDKMGTCSDFATAFTLLAGYAGLSVRYTEGYIPREVSYEEYLAVSTENGIDNSVRFPDGMHFYTVSSHDAHAYPEVYIGGMWVRFEPTVGGPATGDFDTEAVVADNTTERLAYVIFFSFLGAAAILFLLLRPKMAEAIFRVRLSYTEKKIGKKEALRLMFARIAKKINNKMEIPTDSQTVFEVADMLKETCDITPIAIPLSAAVFGDEEITDYDKALDCYRNAIDKIKRS
jgi:transglutaminase-like putative cysteine protease